MHTSFLLIGVYLASIVEAVEALTIVLAMGTTRGWRSTWYGVAAGLFILSLIIAILGPAVTILPINDLRLVVGGLLLIFGVQWLKKSILRASGLKPLHDETAIYNTAKSASNKSKQSQQKFYIDDWYAFVVSFKGVLLEGLEVAFIVITFGVNQGSISLASIAALMAVVTIAVVGMKVRRPLSRIPENTIKFIVGSMLTSFGIFWGAEGAGIRWPGTDTALLVILAFITITASIFIILLRPKPRVKGKIGQSV